jgi:hypothetical protein
VQQPQRRFLTGTNTWVRTPSEVNAAAVAAAAASFAKETAAAGGTGQEAEPAPAQQGFNG